MQRGSVIVSEEKREPPKPQTSSGGSIIRGGRKAPPHTSFRKRKVGDKVRVLNNRLGIIKKIRTNGHESYLVAIRGRSQWFSEFDVK